METAQQMVLNVPSLGSEIKFSFKCTEDERNNLLRILKMMVLAPGMSVSIADLEESR